jgi:hypothetical protein
MGLLKSASINPERKTFSFTPSIKKYFSILPKKPILSCDAIDKTSANNSSGDPFSFCTENFKTHVKIPSTEQK